MRHRLLPRREFPLTSREIVRRRFPPKSLDRRLALADNAPADWRGYSIRDKSNARLETLRQWRWESWLPAPQTVDGGKCPREIQPACHSIQLIIDDARRLTSAATRRCAVPDRRQLPPTDFESVQACARSFPARTSPGYIRAKLLILVSLRPRPD